MEAGIIKNLHSMAINITIDCYKVLDIMISHYIFDNDIYKLDITEQIQISRYIKNFTKSILDYRFSGSTITDLKSNIERIKNNLYSLGVSKDKLGDIEDIIVYYLEDINLR